MERLNETFLDHAAACADDAVHGAERAGAITVAALSSDGAAVSCAQCAARYVSGFDRRNLSIHGQARRRKWRGDRSAAEARASIFDALLCVRCWNAGARRAGEGSAA